LATLVFNLLIVNWAQTAGVAIGAGVISLLMSIVSAKTGDNNSALLVVATKEAK
jgi:Putative lactococcus lactis phage r1t holin